MPGRVAQRKFGCIPTPEEFGYYIPSEHIDSPAGLVGGRDLLTRPPNITRSVSGTASGSLPKSLTEQESAAPSATAGSSGATIFNVDQTGVMAYVRRTNRRVERRLELAAGKGRTHEGMLHFGAALHAVEDLFAHSNWIEIAVDKMLQENPTLLPQLQGSERRVFTYSPTVTIGEEERPVLTTGSFTTADTVHSIGSELVTVLNTPPAAPTTDAQATAEARLTYELLRTLSDELRRNPTFRAGVRDAIVGSIPSNVVDPIRGTEWFENTVDWLLQRPLHEIYDWTGLPNIPQAVKDAVGVTALQQGIREAMYRHVMRPAAQ